MLRGRIKTSHVRSLRLSTWTTIWKDLLCNTWTSSRITYIQVMLNFHSKIITNYQHIIWLIRLKNVKVIFSISLKIWKLLWLSFSYFLFNFKMFIYYINLDHKMKFISFVCKLFYFFFFSLKSLIKPLNFIVKKKKNLFHLQT